MPFVTSLGSDHTSAGASQAPDLLQDRLRSPRHSARPSAALAQPGQQRPRRCGALCRVLQPARGLRRAGASRSPVIRAALARRTFGSPAEAVAADVRRRLPVPGRVWEAERLAQREPGAARLGEDSGGDGGGGAVARRSRLLKGTPPAGSLPAAAEHLPLRGAARRGSPSGRELRAGVWTARPGSRGGVRSAGAPDPRGDSGGEIQDKCR
ncbi:hypothetical protein H8959_022500, partial [Pygathrix nigripes]